jgi:serine/threonine-protein kinase
VCPGEIGCVPDAPLKTVGKYQLTDLLGQGAMGVVYRALDPVLNRYVAIKLMGQGVAADEHLRERFMREAQAAGSLQHPNIITIYDFGEVEGHLYIAMEYLEGADLSEVIERGDSLPLPAKLDIIIDALSALHYAHSRHVVHRDIKPANIRVSVDGHAKLMDFGIARLERSDLTKSGVLIGTPHYMAPEQITNGQISPATDIFAMGVVLYELLASRRAFDGDTLHAVLYKVVSEEPPSLRDMSPAIPAALRMIVERAIAKDPKTRYQSAGAMAQALSDVRAQLSGGAAVTIVARRTPLGMMTTAEERKRERRIAVWGGVASAAVIVVAAALGFMVTRGSPRAPANVPQAAPAASPAPATPSPGPSGAGEAAPTGAPAAATPSGVAAQPPRPQPSAPAASVTGREPRAGAASVAAVPSAAPPPRRADSTAAPGAAAPPAQAPAPSPTPANTVQVAAPLAPAPAPVGSQGAPPTSAPPAAASDPRPEIEQLVAAYARAIEARSVSEVRRVYPGLTASQQQGWERFFQSARTVRARLAITSLDVNGAVASLSVSGAYEYEAGAGPQRQSVNFAATAVRDADGWRLQSVR